MAHSDLLVTTLSHLLTAYNPESGTISYWRVRDEKQLLPDFCGSPARNGIDQCVQDSVPSNVIHGFDLFVLVQSCDSLSG